MSSEKRVGGCAILTLLLIALIRSRLHFDPSTYSAGFADRTTLLGIPNFWNVVTNLGFAVVGIAGLVRFRRNPAEYRTLSVIFSASVLGVAFGSSYFHWNPTPSTLFWDELPMSVGFGSFVGMIVADRASPRAGLLLGIALAIAGPASVWNIYYGGGGTGYYLAIQFGALIFGILVLLLTPRSRMKTPLVFLGLLFYVGAKILESNDRAVYDALRGISGHSLKHVSATLGLWAILRGTEVEE